MNTALILSGGIGTRLNSDIPKQYIKVGNRMIISYCLETFAKSRQIDSIRIVCADEWQNDILSDLKAAGIPSDKFEGFSKPGATRQLSILNGLQDIAAASDSDDSIVIIHDAARPNVSIDLIEAGIEKASPCDGAMPVLPMKDTVYLSTDGASVSSLLDRSQIYAGQAPEFFKLKKYLEANLSLLPDKIMSINGSTEPAVMAGLDIAMFPGDEKNNKITTRDDLERFQKSVE